MFEQLMEPFRYFTPALVAATLSGALLGLVGVYVVLRGMAYIGHGLSHAIFGWAVVSFAGGVNFYVGAGAGGVLSALLINALARRKRITADVSIGIVTTAVFALGIAVISRRSSFTKNFEAALFGNVLGVSAIDVLVIAATLSGVALVVIFDYRRLLYSTFDPEVAEISGISSRVQDLVLTAILAASIIVTMRLLGVTLIAASLITPAATARLLTNRFGKMLHLSVAIGAASGFLGVYLSYFLDVASGASVVLVASVVFAGALLLTSVRRHVRQPA